MKKKLGFAAAVAILAAFFASKSPDGLDKTAEALGFASKGHEHWAIMPDYKLPFIGHQGLSTVLTAIIGILAVYAVFMAVTKLGNRKASGAK